MGDGTGIEWTDSTWNPTTGCDRVSPGCDHCYALTTAKRMKAMGVAAYQQDGDPRTSGPGFGLTMHASRLDQPIRWTRPRRIFVNSMSDLFHAKVTDEFIAEVWAVMALAGQHTFQVLTKRHGRLRSLLSSPEFPGLVQEAASRRDPSAVVTLPIPNVWVGVSVEDQQRADLRVPALLDTPAAVRFLSMEPLLGPVDLVRSINVNPLAPYHFRPGGIDWIIVGGESGTGARPMHPGWVRHLRDQASAAGVAFLFKQWGNFAPVEDEPRYGDVWVLGTGYASMVVPDDRGEVGSMPTQPWHPGTAGAEPGKWDRYGDALVRPMHKKAAGRLLDGRTWDGYPSSEA